MTQESLTLIQREVLCAVADADGYLTRDGNGRTMLSLRRRGLVTRPTGQALWWLTDAGIDVVAAWDRAGCL